MMRPKQFIRFLFFTFLICIFFTCSENSNQNTSDKKITIKMITHGQATDPFWNVVRNGAKDAAQDLGISVQYQSPLNFDMVTMSRMIDAVIATNPDGLILSVPDIPALKKSIISASKNNFCKALVAEGVPMASEYDYNPFKYKTFVNTEDHEPQDWSEFAYLSSGKGWKNVEAIFTREYFSENTKVSA